MLAALKDIVADSRFRSILSPRVKDGPGFLQTLLYQNFLLALFALTVPGAIPVALLAGILFYRLGRSRCADDVFGMILAIVFAISGAGAHWGTVQLQQSLPLISLFSDYSGQIPFPSWAHVAVGAVTVSVGVASFLWFASGIVLLVLPSKKGSWPKFFSAMRKTLIATGPVDRDAFIFGAAVLRWAVAVLVIAAGVPLALLNSGGEFFANGAIPKMLSVFILSALIMLLALIVLPAWISILFRRVRSADGSLPLAFLALLSGLGVGITHPVSLMMVYDRFMRLFAGDTGSILAYNHIMAPAIGSVAYLIRLACVLLFFYVYLYPEKRRA